MFPNLLPVAYSEKRDHTIVFCYTHGHSFLCWLQIMCLNGKPECWKTHCTFILGAAPSISGLTHFSWSGNMVLFSAVVLIAVCLGMCVCYVLPFSLQWEKLNGAPFRTWRWLLSISGQLLSQLPLLGIFSFLNELGWLSKIGLLQKVGFFLKIVYASNS